MSFPISLKQIDNKSGGDSHLTNTIFVSRVSHFLRGWLRAPDYNQVSQGCLVILAALQAVQSYHRQLNSVHQLMLQALGECIAALQNFGKKETVTGLVNSRHLRSHLLLGLICCFCCHPSL